MELVNQLTVYKLAKTKEEREKEKSRFMRILCVALFECSMNNKNPEALFREIKREVEEQKLKELKELVDAFTTINNILFN